MVLEKTPAGNSTYPKGGVSCSADSFVVAESSVLRMKFCLAPFNQSGNHEFISKGNKERHEEDLGPPHVILKEKVVHIEHPNEE